MTNLIREYIFNLVSRPKRIIATYGLTVKYHWHHILHAKVIIVNNNTTAYLQWSSGQAAERMWNAVPGSTLLRPPPRTSCCLTIAGLESETEYHAELNIVTFKAMLIMMQILLADIEEIIQNLMLTEVVYWMSRDWKVIYCSCSLGIVHWNEINATWLMTRHTSYKSIRFGGWILARLMHTRYHHVWPCSSRHAWTKQRIVYLYIHKSNHILLQY